MKQRGSSVSVVTLVAVAVSFTACSRVPGMKPAQAVAGVATQPAPQKPQPSSAPQTALPSLPQALPASPPLPVAAPKSDASAPKVVVSDRSQTLVIAQQTFRFVTHVQSIERTNEETVEWWELRDAKEQRGHMEVRRAANEELRALRGAPVEAEADETESRAKDRILALAPSSFKKIPDAPLGEVLMRKLKRRREHAKGRKSR